LRFLLSLNPFNIQLLGQYRPPREFSAGKPMQKIAARAVSYFEGGNEDCEDQSKSE